MKTLQKIASIVAGLSLALSGYGQGASPSFSQVSFLTGGGNLILSNNTTYSFNNANFPYLKSDWTTNIASLSNYWTNTITQPSGTIVSNFLTYGPATKDIALSPRADASEANVSLFIVAGNTNWPPPGISDDRITIVPAYSNIATSAYTAVTSSNTNTLTIVIAPIRYGTNAESGITANQFTWTIGLQGTTPIVTSTNLPSDFIKGTKGIRLVSVSASSVTDVIANLINSLGVSQWKP